MELGGTVAWAEFSTPVWQYLQSILLSPACILWLKGMGWSGE
ncbi:hypothetical protein LEP1GSC196_3815 [Leptospira meyeri serovar Semaranga str. Veldrot Semarang 173]|nr:hypothetical protein LEP1GSC196_3815 [Leptospira meyeri serovar Semaranga str. Veldrot Semarang 173]